MPRKSRKPSVALLTGLFLMALLPVLAVLQYRWLGETSNAEREKMRESLNSGASQFAHDVDRELTRAYILFQVNLVHANNSEADEIGQSFAKWKVDSAYPDMISAIYSAGPAEDGNVNLLKFDPENSSLAPVAWPETLARIKDSLNEKPVTGPTGIKVPSIPQFVISGGVPVLVLAQTKYDLTGGVKRPDLTSSTASTIIVFNLDYMRQKMFPELARRYFSGQNGLDYNLMILAQPDSGSPIYSSDPGLKQSDLSTPDVEKSFLGVQMEDLKSIFAVEANGLLAQKGIHTTPNAIYQFSRIKVIKSPDWPAWRLVAKNKAGSLEAVVVSTRRRNLAISFGILTLLGAAIALVLVSTYRASRLARQQMEFVAGVSHEFRTPLAVISSAAQNLADGVIDDPARAQRYGELIESESRRLIGMVEQVLELAGAQSNRDIYNSQPVSIYGSVGRALSAVNHLLQENSFEFETDLPSGLPDVAADPDALCRSIQNLVCNSVKYAGESRWVRISASLIPDAKQQRVDLTVEDRGIGISADDIPNIFKPFFRARDVVDAQIHGSGLGLSLVKNSVEAAGGSVSVRSVPGQGSSFTLHLLVAVQLESNRPALERGPAVDEPLAGRG